jgi:tripartite-type tricarboxylate transporter receptor subunit TctC
MQRRGFVTSLAAVAALAFGVISNAFAQDAWPTKAVRFVIPFPGGSATDVLGRHVAFALGEKWGKQVVIDNKPGGSGVIGVTSVLNSPADGYTFLLTQGSAIVVVPKTIRGVTYDFNRDFVPVAMVATSPLMIAAPADSPFKTLGDLVQAAKGKPEAIEIADVGLNTIPHLAAANLGHNAGVKFLHVHYQGGPPAITATIGGQAKAVFETLGPIRGMVQGGKLKVLASMSDRMEKGLERYPLAKDTVPGAVAQGWFSLLARKGTNEAVIRKVNADVNEVLARPGIIAKFDEMAAYPRPGSPADLAAYYEADHKFWGEVIDKLGIKPE